MSDDPISDLENKRRPDWITEYVPEDLIAPLFKLKVKLPNGNAIDVDMTSTVDVDYENLEIQLQHTPSQYVFWATVYSEAKAYVAVIERAIKVRKGVLVEVLVKEAKAQTLRAPTDKTVAALLESDQIITKLEEALIRAQKTAGKLWHMCQAIQMKSEHLRSLSGFKRQEQQQTSRS